MLDCLHIRVETVGIGQWLKYNYLEQKLCWWVLTT